MPKSKLRPATQDKARAKARAESEARARANAEATATVYPYALYAEPHQTEEGPRERVTVLTFNPCRRKDVTTLAAYLFTTDLVELKLPAPILIVVAYLQEVEPATIIDAVAHQRGLDTVPGCAEIRVPQGSQILNGAAGASFTVGES